MKIRSVVLVTMVAGSFAAGPSWADRVYVSGGAATYARTGHSGGYRSGYSHHVRGHGYGHGHYWAPLGLVLGTAVLYSALHSRTYYEPRVVYAPPVYYSPPTTFAQPYPIAGDPVVQAYATLPVASMPVQSPVLHGVQNAIPGPGASGEYWWYVCKNPVGYYPNVTECPSGWTKLPPTPSGKVNP